RKFDGQCFLFYFFWYGLGRAWIEGLRTDSLYLFGWELFGAPIRVSQLFAAITCVIAGAALVWALWRNRSGKELFVDRLAAQAARTEDSGEEE
ncbi:MAG: prolipoprotein diacylglyceryl transferase, partial [Lawsonibacter sp.]|nr:prolipoprotein diacylglyceryl transferase [Lawsonibacter sp.]